MENIKGDYGAKLVGVNGEELTINVGRKQLLELEVEFVPSNWMMPNPIFVMTNGIGSLDISPLLRLTEGQKGQEFNVYGENVCITIYDGRWGVRTSAIVECKFSSVGWDAWPDRDQVSEYLLDRECGAVFVNSAFLVSDEKLSQFALDFAKQVKAIQSN